MSEKLKNYLLISFEIALLCFLFFLRIFTLEEDKLYDYDAVSNYLVIQEITTGNFQHFFQHASPGFYLFYIWILTFAEQDIWLQYLNVVINLLVVVFLVEIFYDHIKLKSQKKGIDKLFLYGFAGTSFFSLNSALYFSIENLSVLLFFICFIFYHQSLKQGSKFFIWSAFIWGVLYTVNYKAILLLPIFLLLEIIQRRRGLRLGMIFWGIVVAMIPSLVCILIGVWGGENYWRYPAVIYLSLTATSSGEMGSQFGGDFFYYFKYIFCFENLLLIPGILIFFYYKIKIMLGQLKQGDLLMQIAFVCICYFAGMSLLLKAPRGLAFIYPMMYLLAWVGLRILWEKSFFWSWLIKFILIGSFLVSFYRVWVYIYPYTTSNYDKVAAYLEEKKIRKVVVSVGNKILPYFQDIGIEAVLIRNENELEQYIQQGYEYLILDDFYQVVNLRNFDRVSRTSPDYQWVEPSLLSPMIHLEHSEFTRFTFEQSLRNRQRLSEQEYHLHLIKLKKP